MQSNQTESYFIPFRQPIKEKGIKTLSKVRLAPKIRGAKAGNGFLSFVPGDPLCCVSRE